MLGNLSPRTHCIFNGHGEQWLQTEHLSDAVPYWECIAEPFGDFQLLKKSLWIFFV